MAIARIDPYLGFNFMIEIESSVLGGFAEAAGLTQDTDVVPYREGADFQLNVRQLMKCCIEEITPDGRIIPLCAYNSVGYREQIREQFSGTPVAPVVPNARQLQPLLQPTRHGSKTVAGANVSGAGAAIDQTNIGRKLGR